MSKKRKIFNYIILAIVLFYSFIYEFVLKAQFKNKELIITSVFFILIFIASVGINGFAKNKLNPLKKSVTKIVTIMVILGIGITYTLGIFVGFIKNGCSFEIINLIKNITIPIILVIFTELFRYNLIRSNKDDTIFVAILTLFLSILEIQMNIVAIHQLGLREIFVIATTVVIPVVAKNIVLSYLDYEVGYQPCLIYRLLLEIHVFLVPYLPNLGDYLKSMYGLCLPLIVFIYASDQIDESENGIKKQFMNSKISKILEIPIYAIIIIVIALISRLFPIFTMGIGSESMTGTLNKCDAIIACKVKEENIQVNDIIVFQTSDKILIHRVVEIEEKDGVKHYRTKGDANGTRDNVDVTYSKIHGKVLLRIPYIAYPSVWLSEKIKK